MTIDGVEKLGRLVLWLALSSVCVLIPFGAIEQHRDEEKRRKLAQAQEEKVAAALETAKTDLVPARLSFKSMGPSMRALSTAKAEGRLWFTNISSRSGVVCVQGIATNTKTSGTAKSLPSCEKVDQYTTVNMTVMFADGQLHELCKDNNCEIGFDEL